MHRAILLCLVLAGCKDKTPADLELVSLGTLTSTGQEAPLTVKVTNKAGEELVEAKATFAAAPPDVAVITQAGGVRCLKTGDASITASLGAITTTRPLSCRVVERVRGPKVLKLSIPDTPPITPKYVALDGADRPVDLAPELSVTDPTVVSIVGGKLLGRTIGITTLTASVGDKKAVTEVVVSRKVEARALLLNDGARQNLTLPAGRYLVKVKVTSRGTGFGVTLTWVGGSSDCENSPERQSIVSHCTLPSDGAFIIENPTTLGLGPPADGLVSIVEIPSQGAVPPAIESENEE